MAVTDFTTGRDAIVVERERVLALLDAHAAKYLNPHEQQAFAELITWVKDDARQTIADQQAPSSAFIVSAVDLRDRYEARLDMDWKADDITGPYPPAEMPAVSRFVEWLLTNYDVIPKA